MILRTFFSDEEEWLLHGIQTIELSDDDDDEEEKPAPTTPCQRG